MKNIESVDVGENRLYELSKKITQEVLDHGKDELILGKAMEFAYIDAGEPKRIVISIGNGSVYKSDSPTFNSIQINLTSKDVKDGNRAVISGLIASQLARKQAASDESVEPWSEELSKAYAAYALNSTDYAVYRILTTLATTDNPRAKTLRDSLGDNANGVITALINLVRDANDEQASLIDQYESTVLAQTKYMGIG